MKNCIHPPVSPSDEIVYLNTSGSTILAGTVLKVADTFAIAVGDIPNNESGVIYAAGRYRLAKPTGVGQDLAQGDLVGFNTGTQQTIKTPTNASVVLGRVAVAAGVNDTTVVVDIVPGAVQPSA